MSNVIFITVVIEKTKSNSLPQPHAVQVEKQVDLDQGSKMTRFRAFSSLVVGFAFKKLFDFIIDKF